MRVHVKCMGVLKPKTPEGNALELPDGATLKEMMDELDIPLDRIQVVSVNGSLVHDLTRQLNADDDLTVLAPVGGG